MPTLRIAQDDSADELLGRDPLALLIGMLLDQQFPMERAFGAPRLLADRLGVSTLSAVDLAAADPEELVRVFQGPPALHRYPGSMAARTQDLCRLLIERYDGRADNLWADDPVTRRYTLPPEHAVCLSGPGSLNLAPLARPTTFPSRADLA